MATYKYVIPLRPRPWSRAGYNGKCRVFYDKQAEDKLLMGFYILRDHAGRPKLTVPLHMRVVFVLPRPLNRRRKFTRYPSIVPDLDNYFKLVGDALQKNEIISNDALIVKTCATKIYGKEAKTIFTLTELTNKWEDDFDEETEIDCC